MLPSSPGLEAEFQSSFAMLVDAVWAATVVLDAGEGEATYVSPCMLVAAQQEALYPNGTHRPPVPHLDEACRGLLRWCMEHRCMGVPDADFATILEEAAIVVKRQTAALDDARQQLYYQLFDLGMQSPYFIGTVELLQDAGMITESDAGRLCHLGNNRPGVVVQALAAVLRTMSSAHDALMADEMLVANIEDTADQPAEVEAQQARAVAAFRSFLMQVNADITNTGETRDE